MSKDLNTPTTDPSPGKKAERAQASRQALLASARDLFESKGYAATSTEELLARTGLTRGALYHHFRDKRAVFDAVCNAVHEELVHEIAQATRQLADPAQALRAGCHAWMRAVAEPRRARLLLIEAPAVLGPEAWNAADARHGYASLREGVQAALQDGGQAPAARDAAALALNGAMNELARWVAAQPGQLPAALAAVDAVIAGFVRPA